MHRFGTAALTALTRPLPVLARQDETLDPVIQEECTTILSDLSVAAVLDAAGRIHQLARRVPNQYRLTTGPWLYLEGRSAQIRDAMRDQYQAKIVSVMDPTITDYDYWALDACGIKIWSPGA